MAQLRSLNVFDFDGTLFKSPAPNPKVYDKAVVGKLKSTVESGGFGWFQDPVTLSEPYVTCDPSWFVPEVKQKVIESMADPNAVTVLLTGRNVKYSDILTKLIEAGGLKFDAVGLKPLAGEKELSTLDFKKGYINNLIQTYKPLNNIVIYEDREEHQIKLEQFLKETCTQQNIPKYSVIKVPQIETYLPFSVEQELVSRLKQNSRCQVELVRSVSYTGVFLDQLQAQKLKQLLPPIPDWTQYYHHMTVCLGPLQNTEKDGLPAISALGTTVTLVVTGFGRSEKAFAARVTGYPTINKIPHITLCTAPNARPVESNNITEWTEFSKEDLSNNPEQYTFSGILGEHFTIQAGRPPKKNNNSNAKFPIVKLLKEHSQISGKEFGAAIKQVTEWTEKNNLTNSEDDITKIIEYINKNLKISQQENT